VSGAGTSGDGTSGAGTSGAGTSNGSKDPVAEPQCKTVGELQAWLKTYLDGILERVGGVETEFVDLRTCVKELEVIISIIFQLH